LTLVIDQMGTGMFNIFKQRPADKLSTWSLIQDSKY
jgi:hypothetical protein